MIEVLFQINYFTNFGDEIAVVGNLPQVGNWNPNRAKKMFYKGDGYWNLTLQFEVDSTIDLEYCYIIVQKSGSFIYEDSSKRTLSFLDLKLVPSVFIWDTWKSTLSSEEVNPHLKSSIFSDVIFRRESKMPNSQSLVSKYSDKDEDKVIIRFLLYSVFVPPKSSIRIVGNISDLGDWDFNRAPKMNDHNYPLWNLEISIPKINIPFQYKFVISRDVGGNQIWEEGSNRQFWNKEQPFAIIDGGKFKRSLQWRGTGVSLPVFSIRTKNSLGVGEFLDLKLMVDWAVSTGLKLIQILPVNDTSSRGDWRDSYPYR